MSFYEQLKPILKFEESQNSEHFFPAPPEWHVIIADIKGSTDLTAQGRYRDVNLIASAVIANVINTLQSRDFPFSFGGDGATLLVPPEKLNQVMQGLQSIRKMAAERFSIHLRLGSVQVKTIYEEKKDFLVGKVQVAPQSYLAAFMGGGSQLAEKIIKSHNDSDQISSGISNVSSLESPNLQGLSCRWAPFKSQNGVILSIIVRSKFDDFNSQKVYFFALDQIKKALGKNLTELNPLAEKSFHFANPIRSLIKEYKLAGSLSAIPKSLFELAFVYILKTFKLTKGKMNAENYARETVKNCDYMKLDDALRIVLDVSEDQKKSILEILETGQIQAKWDYGLQESSAVIMTCYVEEMADNKHVHFVDGSDGGHTFAAKKIKSKVKGSP